MGGLCTTNVQTLPDPKNVLKDTELPEWISAGGQKLFQQAAELSASDFPEFQGPRIATYDAIDPIKRSAGGELITDPETGEYVRGAVDQIPVTDPNTGEVTFVTPKSKLTAQEQRGLELLETGGDVYDQYITRADELSRTIGEQSIDSGEFNYDAFGKADIDKYLDYYTGAVDPALTDVSETFAKRQRDLSLAAGKTGAFGDRMGLEGAELTRGEARERGKLLSEAGRAGLEFASGQYERDRAAAERQFELNRIAGQTDFDLNQAGRRIELEAQTKLAPLAQGLVQQESQGLIASGEAQRMLDQQALDLAYRDYVEQREYPFTAVNFAIGALKGLPFETREFSMQRGGEFVQTPSVYGQTMGGLGALASAYKLLS